MVVLLTVSCTVSIGDGGGGGDSHGIVKRVVVIMAVVAGDRGCGDSNSWRALHSGNVMVIKCVHLDRAIGLPNFAKDCHSYPSSTHIDVASYHDTA